MKITAKGLKELILEEFLRGQREASADRLILKEVTKPPGSIRYFTVKKGSLGTNAPNDDYYYSYSNQKSSDVPAKKWLWYDKNANPAIWKISKHQTALNKKYASKVSSAVATAKRTASLPAGMLPKIMVKSGTLGKGTDGSLKPTGDPSYSYKSADKQWYWDDDGEWKKSGLQDLLNKKYPGGKEKKKGVWKKPSTKDPVQTDKTTWIQWGHKDTKPNSNVKKVQSVVKVKADGYFGKGTKAAVVKWQTSNKLKNKSGIVDEESWKKIISGPADAAPAAAKPAAKPADAPADAPAAEPAKKTSGWGADSQEERERALGAAYASKGKGRRKRIKAAQAALEAKGGIYEGSQLSKYDLRRFIYEEIRKL